MSDEMLCAVSVHAIQVTADAGEIRRYWKLDETPIIDAAVACAPSLVVGIVDAMAEERRGPAARVSRALELYGTEPDYVLPVLDGSLIDALLEAVDRREDDPPWDSVSREAFAEFLHAHRGMQIVERSGVVTQPRWWRRLRRSR